jgi:hypothetical protein
MCTLYCLAHTVVLTYLNHHSHILSTVLTAHDRHHQKTIGSVKQYNQVIILELLLLSIVFAASPTSSMRAFDEDVVLFYEWALPNKGWMQLVYNRRMLRLTWKIHEPMKEQHR